MYSTIIGWHVLLMSIKFFDSIVQIFSLCLLVPSDVEEEMLKYSTIIVDLSTVFSVLSDFAVYILKLCFSCISILDYFPI